MRHKNLRTFGQEHCSRIQQGHPRWRCFFWISLVTAFSLVSSAFAEEANTYRNPVIDQNLADPVVLEHEGVYYLYATGMVQNDNGYRVFLSDDLVHWKQGPVVFQPGLPHIWAPDVWYDQSSDRFYLYYTANKTIGVAESNSPLGPFTDTKVLSEQAIDAHLFEDDDGRLYLYYVRFPGFRITVQPMADPRTPAGQSKTILQPKADWETRNGHVTEGPWMIKNDGLYYLLYSGSGAKTPDYAVGYATSSNPLGPFVRSENNPILHRKAGLFGPGHGCALQDDHGNWWHVYHQKRTDRIEWDRFICLDPMHFDKEGRLHAEATRRTAQPAPIVHKKP